MEYSCNIKFKSSHILGNSIKTAPTYARAFWVILFIILSMGVAIAQTNSVSLKLTNVTVKEALERLKSQTGCSLWFNAQDVALNRRVSIDVKDQNIKNVLEEILKGQDLTVDIKGKSIQIRKTTFQAKKNTVRKVVGQVCDGNDKAPMIGCSVRIKGKGSGTVTDMDGKFSLDLAPTDVLIVSFIGYEPYECVVGNKTVCNIYLEEQGVSLQDVVITGYQTLRKFNTTGAVSTLSEKAIEKRSSVGLSGILEGAIPGLTVYNGRYSIRGGASLNAGTTPLFIVDDFEVAEADLPKNMDVVENITVLKDAAATAIWGARAANGVVVITTKQGKDKGFKISYSNSFKVGAKPDYNDLNRVNSAQLIDYQVEAYDKGWINKDMYDGNSAGYSKLYEIIIERDRGNITRQEMDAQLQQLSQFSNAQQIKDKLLRNSFTQQHFLSVSGSTEKVSYFLSGSFNGGNSSYIGDSNRSTSINSRTSYKLLSNLTLRSDIVATFSKNDNGYGGIVGDIYSLSPYQMLEDKDGYVYDYSLFNKAKAEELEKAGFYSYRKNILQEIDLANNTNKNTAYKVRIGGDYEIIKGLSLSTDYQYEKYDANSREIISKDSYTTRNQLNYMTEIKANNGGIIRHLPEGDILNNTRTNTDSWVFRTVGRLNRTFGSEDKHYVNAVVGFEVRKRVTTSESYRRFGYDDNLLVWKPFDQKTLAVTGIRWWDNQSHSYNATTYDRFGEKDIRERSYFGSMVYTYDNRYTLSGSVRMDESNLFGVNSKYRKNPIWAFGANWNVANENFFSSKVITALMLRASLGLTGNYDRTGSTTPVMVGARSYVPAAGGYVTRISTPPNPFLRWERSRSTNVSADISLWNRLNASLTYYYNYSYDLLGQTNLNPSTGYSSAKINAADMKNGGFELTVNGDIIRTRDFTWNAGVVLSYNKNKILNNKIADGAAYANRVSGTTKFVEGYSREALWAYNWGGLDATGSPTVLMANGERTKIRRDLKADDLLCVGTTQPLYNGSIRTGLRYRSLQLDLLFTYNYGHVFRVEYPTMNPWEDQTMNKLVANRWRKAGDEALTDIPSLLTMDNMTNDDWAAYDSRMFLARYSSNSIRKAGSMRLREILLNYDFPMSVLKHTSIKRLSLTAQLNNVALWAQNKEGDDPEAVNPVSGSFGLTNPISFTAGVKIDF